jgi:hypothetical protein
VERDGRRHSLRPKGSAGGAVNNAARRPKLASLERLSPFLAMHFVGCQRPPTLPFGMHFVQAFSVPSILSQGPQRVSSCVAPCAIAKIHDNAPLPNISTGFWRTQRGFWRS